MTLFINIILNFFLIAFIALPMQSLASEARSFELYQPIIDKCLFGPPPADPTVIPDKNSVSNNETQKTEKELAKEQEQLEKAVSVSALIQKPDGTIMVGFSDSSDRKTPIHYYLAIGESKNGWVVENADITSKKVILQKDGIEIERILGDKGNTNATKPTAETSYTTRSSLLSNRSNGLLRPKTGLLSRRALRLQETENQRLQDLKREEDRKKAEEDAALRREQENAERDEQRQRLMALQEEMRKIREEKNKNNEANAQNKDQES